MNMFPTDLHGPCGDNFYISSLRRGGKANDQVEQSRKVAVSFVPVEQNKSVYSFGKNHMQEMQSFSMFTLSSQSSSSFNIPLPAGTLRYKELEQFSSFDAGIHRIHFYRCVHTAHVQNGRTLSHIHQYYAQWMSDNRIAVNMYFR
jgi:flavin reductase (DIM6/NTAB) family NADH-FMN oxidoreductase RutF